LESKWHLAVRTIDENGGRRPRECAEKAAPKEGLGHLRELAEKLQNEASLIAISDQQNGT